MNAPLVMRGFVVGATLLCMGLIGCAPDQGHRGIVTRTKTPDSLVYPSQAPARDIDVTAVRDEDRLVVTNRTGTRMSSVVVWINRQWACWVAQVPVDVPVHVSLARFVDRNGERFPLPTWLAPDATVEIVCVDLYAEQPEPSNAVVHGGGAGLKPGTRHRAVIDRAQR